MNRMAILRKIDVVGTDVILTVRSDESGNLLHCVEFPDDDTKSGKNYFFFKHLSSALDFIRTNSFA